ncbi:hypothetical protein QQP08_008009 [Theobroma cacao]|nr:hypothetical protein QQP08_008009 [Theobroma cacao]
MAFVLRAIAQRSDERAMDQVQSLISLFDENARAAGVFPPVRELHENVEGHLIKQAEARVSSNNLPITEAASQRLRDHISLFSLLR